MAIQIPRRNFLASVPLIGTAAFLQAQTNEQSDSDRISPLVDSPPVLQNPTKTSISVAWAVQTPATGWVEFGTTPQLGTKAITPVFGLNPYDDRFLYTRIGNLKPNTAYYYRTATAAIDFKTAYNITTSEPVYSETYKFTTLATDADSCSFAVINDTHQNLPTLKALTARLDEEKADFTVWNGDLLNDVYTVEQFVQYIMRPADAPFAAEKPLLFVPGNHDYRGPWARNVPKCLTPWIHEDSKDREMGWNFAIRKGPLAMISLDTGEDKPDRHPVFSGLVNFEAGKVAQKEWLARTLKRPEIASAPYIVAFCHIPLYDKRPNANGGDSLDGYASFSRLGLNLWGQLLHEAGVQAVICAHMHQYRCDEPTSDRSWTQIVGGGPDLAKNATIMFAKADAKELTVVVEKLDTKNELGRWSFPPRKID